MVSFPSDWFSADAQASPEDVLMDDTDPNCEAWLRKANRADGGNRFQNVDSDRILLWPALHERMYREHKLSWSRASIKTGS